jgi:tetratricopeptide (TPR) repeat protein
MSPRARVVAVVALVAAVATSVVVGIAARSGGEPSATPGLAPRSGAPPLALDLGIRGDVEAVMLRRATDLYAKGKRSAAAGLFARDTSLEGKVGLAVARWPTGTIDALMRLAAAHPRSGLVQLNLGIARLWAGKPGSVEAWRRAASVQPDSSYAVTADNLLYPRLNRDLPTFVPAEAAPLELTGKTPAEQLAILEHRAATGSATDKVLYGVALERLFRPVSARRVFDEAARQAPNDPEAQTAAAVGRFDKANLSASFSRLGPLTKRFPHAATVRFHLGLLLLWIGSVKEAEKQLQLATTVEPGSPLAREAQQYLTSLRGVSTG